jgi:hypothetical protein
MRASDAQEPSRRRRFVRPNQMEAIMIGKLVRGLVGEKLAPRLASPFPGCSGAR